MNLRSKETFKTSFCLRLCPKSGGEVVVKVCVPFHWWRHLAGPGKTGRRGEILSAIAPQSRPIVTANVIGQPPSCPCCPFVEIGKSRDWEIKVVLASKELLQLQIYCAFHETKEKDWKHCLKIFPLKEVPNDPPPGPWRTGFLKEVTKLGSCTSGMYRWHHPPLNRNKKNRQKRRYITQQLFNSIGGGVIPLNGLIPWLRFWNLSLMMT